MNQNDLLRAGSDILNAVTDAVENNDFSDLSRRIQNTIGDTISQSLSTPRQAPNTPAVRRDQNPYNSGANPYKNSKNKNGSRVVRGDAGNPHKTVVNNMGQMAEFRSGRKITPFMQRNVSGAVPILKIIFGVIGLLNFGLLAIGGLALLLDEFSPGYLVAELFIVAIAGLFTWMTVSGAMDKGLIDRYKLYGSIIGDNEFYDIRTLTSALGKKASDVLKDIKKMMKKGILPQVRLDKSETTIMMTERAFDQYIQSEESRKEREKEEAEKYSEYDSPEQAKEVEAIIKEGNAYINAINKANDDIPDKALSDKLDTLVSIMDRIFDQVKKDPGSAKNLRRFMDFYLPTTTKLLNAYIELQNQPETDNVKATKREIEESIDTINNGFEKLLDSLFEEMAMDISSDISVMKTMMAQDGLTDDGMNSTSGLS
ncbi:MAG: 5-bromo-4-chloroindolyl phosphate hydrolysis family protein [Lachnospiraceae bacterium]|nr:5-bromo-4-chloroindolyl phosphate hydrolysis family protein [Lachnospiraceae bacterium]